LIRDELNVKEIEIGLDESSFVTYKAKANFKTLGPKLGKSMKAVADQVAQLGHADIKAALVGGTLRRGDFELKADDLLIVREVREGLVVSATPDLTVALDTTVDHALRLEMLARETINRIQTLRKEAGLSVTDTVDVHVGQATPLLRQAVEAHISYISAEVLADFIRLDSAGEGVSREMEVEGEKARISVLSQRK
jgi:isoleucyl-tRNA synthetase